MVQRGDVMWALHWIWLYNLGGKEVSALYATHWMKAMGSDVRVSSHTQQQPLNPAFSCWTFVFFFISEEVFSFLKVELFPETIYSSVFEKLLERWLICKCEVELLHIPRLNTWRNWGTKRKLCHCRDKRGLGLWNKGKMDRRGQL